MLAFETNGFKIEIERGIATVHRKIPNDVPVQFSVPLPMGLPSGHTNRLELALWEWEAENGESRDFRNVIAVQINVR